MRTRRFYATTRGRTLAQPLVVLVDQDSASAAEIVAGALTGPRSRRWWWASPRSARARCRACISLPGTKAALKLTTAKYYTPSGRSIHKDAYNAKSGEESSDEEDDEDGAPPPADTATAAKPKFKTDSGAPCTAAAASRPTW